MAMMATTAAPTVQQLIELYNLQPHPEGGFYAESYRAASSVEAEHGKRSASTVIYFLITPGSVSRLHRLAHTDEGWHFYLGSPMTVLEISPDGELRKTILGSDVLAGQSVQHVVPKGQWFGSYPNENTEGSYSFVGCTVAPGFEFADFELASRAKLTAEFPQHAKEIEKLTEGLP